MIAIAISLAHVFAGTLNTVTDAPGLDTIECYNRQLNHSIGNFANLIFQGIVAQSCSSLLADKETLLDSVATS